MLSTVGINQSTCFQPNKALPTSTSSIMFNTVLIIVALCATYILNVKTASRCVRAWCVVVMRVCVFHGCVCACFMGVCVCGGVCVFHGCVCFMGVCALDSMFYF